MCALKPCCFYLGLLAQERIETKTVSFPQGKGGPASETVLDAAQNIVRRYIRPNRKAHTEQLKRQEPRLPRWHVHQTLTQTQCAFMVPEKPQGTWRSICRQA